VTRPPREIIMPNKRPTKSPDGKVIYTVPLASIAARGASQGSPTGPFTL
jgi:hypothetical protein